MPCVAVVGAGPAGCAAAAALSAAGLDVLLLERGRPGKDKACGDALLPDAVSLLAEHGVDQADLAHAGGAPFTRIDLRNPERLVWRIPLDPGGWVAPRATVDQRLRDRVSQRCETRYGLTVIDLRIGSAGDGHVLSTTAGDLAAVDAVVLAMGAGNALARRLGIAGDPLPGASMSAYVDDIPLDAPIFQFVPGELAGYGWAFPLAGGRANVGYCALAASPKTLRVASERYLATWTGGTRPAGPLRGGSGPMWSGRGATWHHPAGILACGDSAGLVDPITGEGIAAALRSGHAAGQAVAAWLATGRDPALLADYDAWIRADLAASYRPSAVRHVWSRLCQLASVK